jgi:hypothetical protein
MRQVAADLQDPKSPYWRERARTAAREFCDRYGRQAYDAWCDVSLPDDEPLPSWKALHDEIRAELSRRNTTSCSYQQDTAK